MHLFSIHQMEKASRNICIQQSCWSQYIFKKFDLINYEAQKKNNTSTNNILQTLLVLVYFFCVLLPPKVFQKCKSMADLTRLSLDLVSLDNTCANTFAKCKNAQGMSHNVITHISFTHFHFLCKWCHFHYILMANCSDIADSNRQAIRARGEKSQ